MPAPEVEEILLTLAESPLRAIAAEARQAVAELPNGELASADGRYDAARRQIEAVENAVLFPLERELEALERLPALAESLHLSPHVMVRLAQGEEPRRTAELTSKARRVALSNFARSLGKALGEAREAAYKREFGGRP